MSDPYAAFRPGANCSFCGHETHADACPGHIERGTAKAPKPSPCPCVKRTEAES